MGILVSKLVLLFLRPFIFQTSPLPTQKHLLPLKDRISELPDDVFIVIISHLPLKEAARNSVVSRRWRNRWKVMTRLGFDSFKNADQCFESESDMLNYVNWVNLILDSHQGAKLQEFKMSYGLDKHFDCDIDKWVRFAFSKQVECFDIEVNPFKNEFGRPQNYSLTAEFVKTFVNRKFNGFRHLKSLSFKDVNVDDELLELILNNSPALERLCIKTSRTLSALRVSGPQCMLKSLEVTYGLDFLEINDVATLVSLTYNGPLPRKLIINNVPSLSDLRFSGAIVDAFFGLKMNDLLVQFSSSLKSLTLEMSCVKDFGNYTELPQLTALERLVVQTYNPAPYTDWYACLIQMCPSLREFVYQAQVHSYISLPDGQAVVMNHPPHRCLKEVKILGYYGCTRDVALASYFIRHAVALERIVVDPRDQRPFFWRCAPSTKFEQDSRTRAKKQLKGKVPSRVKLVIL